MPLPRPVQPTWQLRPPDDCAVRALEESSGCPAAIAHMLAARGLSPEQLRTFLEPTISDLHAPDLLLGMNAAVCRIEAAVAAAEPILIYGDYDVDGTTATVLLKHAIDRVTPSGSGSLVTWHVPHRIQEGYGMRSSRLAKAAEAGIRLVISVDTGIRAFAAAAEAERLGLDLIVTDHHLPDPGAGVPRALSVINPAQVGCDYPFKQLCGAAVAFKLAHALLLSHAGRQADHDRACAFLADRLIPSLLKLVAIATIADSVPLIGENRTLALLGLKELAAPKQPGLRALMQVASLPLDRAPSASDVGFRIGPRINAAGRMDVADDVIELFLTQSPERAMELATKLNDLNEARRATEREALETIEAHLLTLLDAEGRYPAECLILDHPDWHRGVLGILASRVVERTGRPALVLTHADGEAHGSGRSIDGFHLLASLTAAHIDRDDLDATLLTRFGGHAHAVGLSLPSPHLPWLRQRMRRVTAATLGAATVAPPLLYDAELTKEALTADLVQWIGRCAPFGNAHPEPVFLVRNLTVDAPPRLIKDRHLCLSLASQPALPELQALGWSRSTDWAVAARDLALTTGSQVDLVCRVRLKESQWFTGIELDLCGLRLVTP